MKVSILIPSRNEPFLPNTVADILAHATGDIEVIVVLDGYWHTTGDGHTLALPDDPRLTLIHRGVARGMRAAINGAADIAKGDFLMKCDAHCMFAEGFDEVLQADCDQDWIVIPRRKRLDAENWGIQDVGKPDVDYEYLGFPYFRPDEPGMHGTIWTERIRERMHGYDLDENMSFQGSCWFMSKRHWVRLGGMSDVGYGTFIQEPQEIGLKTWLGGGKVMVNKKTWYAHLHKGKKYGRGYFFSKQEAIDGNAYSTDYWLNNRWPGRVHDLAWLVERFWPVPTWPDDRKLWTTPNETR